LRRTRNKTYTILLLIPAVTIIVCGDCFAQEDNQPQDTASSNKEQVINRADTITQSTLIAPLDSTTAIKDSIPVDSIIFDPILYQPGEDMALVEVYHLRDSTGMVDRSPTLTMFKSVAFPGWGQFCNRKYIKVGLVFAIESYFIYKAIDFAGKASDWRKKWKDAPTELKNEYFAKYTDNRDKRNSNMWYTALIIFLSMFDAYVDAHLQNFPKDIPDNENLSLSITTENETRVVLSYRF
jgi:hypothetical protein